MRWRSCPSRWLRAAASCSPEERPCSRRISSAGQLTIWISSPPLSGGTSHQQGSDRSDDPSAFQQAGELLALFHAQAAATDHNYEMRENEKALAWLSGPHRITAPVMGRLRAQIAAWPTDTWYRTRVR